VEPAGTYSRETFPHLSDDLWYNMPTPPEVAMAVSRATASLFDLGWSPTLPVCRAERASARSKPREPSIKSAGGGCRIPAGTAERTQQRI